MMRDLSDMKVYTAIRRCMKIIFVMFGACMCVFFFFLVPCPTHAMHIAFIWLSIWAFACVFCVYATYVYNCYSTSLVLAVIAAYRLHWSLVVYAA